MTESNEKNEQLFEILTAVSNIDLSNTDEGYSGDGSTPISRGLHSGDNEKRNKLYLHICERQRKNNLASKLNELKESILHKNRKDGVNILASLMGDLLEQSEKSDFITNLSANRTDEDRQSTSSYESVINPNNPDYIPFVPSNSTNMEQERNPPIIIHNSPFNKKKGNIKLPIESQYNSSEIYLFEKGIHYCRLRLQTSFQQNDDGFIKELKMNCVLNIILSEDIGKDKSYIRDLVDKYPTSLDEIKFLILNDKETILKSSIFAHMAQKNLANLTNMLKKLQEVVDKSTLIKACQQSEADGVKLLSILEQDHQPEMKPYAHSIKRFINRHRQGPTYHKQ